MVLLRRYPEEQMQRTPGQERRPHNAVLNATQVLTPKTATQHPPRANRSRMRRCRGGDRRESTECGWELLVRVARRTRRVE
jgi:hypothetical protein